MPAHQTLASARNIFLKIPDKSCLHCVGYAYICAIIDADNGAISMQEIVYCGDVWPINLKKCPQLQQTKGYYVDFTIQHNTSAAKGEL